MSSELGFCDEASCRFREIVEELNENLPRFRAFIDVVKNQFQEAIQSIPGHEEFPKKAREACCQILCKWSNVNYGYFLAYIYARHGTVSSTVAACYEEDFKLYDDSDQRLSDFAVANQDRTVRCSQDGMESMLKKLDKVKLAVRMSIVLPSLFS